MADSMTRYNLSAKFGLYRKNHCDQDIKYILVLRAASLLILLTEADLLSAKCLSIVITHIFIYQPK